ncbi:MAG: DMT family transporter [Anaerolineae bacterium]
MGQLKEWGIFLFLSTVWGSSFLLIKIAVAELSPMALVAVRLFFATIGLWLIVAITRVRVPTDFGTLSKLVFLGVINTAIPFTLIAFGEQHIDSGVASILNSGTPLFALVLAHLFLPDERITPAKLIGLMMGFGGVVLIFSRGLGASFLDAASSQLILIGQAAVLAASACYAIGAVYTRRTFRGVHAIVLAAVPITAAFVTTTAGALVFESPIDLRISLQVLGALLVLGFLGVSAAHIGFFHLIYEWGATRTTLVTYLIPVVGLTLGVLILDEPLDWRLIAGFVAVISGVYLVNRRSRRAGQPSLEQPAK